MRLRKGVFVSVVLMMLASLLLVAPAASGDSHIDCDDAYVKVHGPWIKVLPTGVDDTQNLQCAFDLAGTMPWAKVKLIAGDYYTGFLEAEDVALLLHGAGMGKTTVYTLPAGLDCAAWAALSGGPPNLLTFVSSDVAVVGITFGIGGDAPCATPWDGFEDNGFGFEERSIVAIAAAERLRLDEACPAGVDHSLRVFDVAVVSEFPDFTADFSVYKNYLAGVFVGRLADPFMCPDTWLHGDVVVMGSHFSGNGVSLSLNITEDSKVLVGGNKPWMANTFDDVGFGVRMSNHNNSDLRIKGNHINDAHWWGIFVISDEGIEISGDELSKVLIAKNRIRAIDNADGIGVIDLGPETVQKPIFDTRIMYNTIEMVQTDFNGIVGLGTDGLIKGNRIFGESFSGILLDGISFDYDEDGIPDFEYTSQGWHIVKNNLKGMEPYFADIFLTPWTEKNYVKCMCRHDTVIDFGVDNVLRNCTLIDPPPEEPEAALQFAPAEATPAFERAMKPGYVWTFER